jgi:hypothetical protein
MIATAAPHHVAPIVSSWLWLLQLLPIMSLQLLVLGYDYYSCSPSCHSNSCFWGRCCCRHARYDLSHLTKAHNSEHQLLLDWVTFPFVTLGYFPKSPTFLARISSCDQPQICVAARPTPRGGRHSSTTTRDHFVPHSHIYPLGLGR